MADISALGNLEPTQTLNLNDYAAPKVGTGFRLPKAGRYTLRAPESFTAASFGKSRSNNLTVQIDPTIVGGDHDGFNIRFTRVSAKTYERDGKQVSQLGDYLLACGLGGEVPGDPQAAADAAEQTANATFEAVVDWKARDSATGAQVKGMKNFPSDGNGGYQSWTTLVDPSTGEVIKDENGDPKRFRANLEIVKFIPAAV